MRSQFVVRCIAVPHDLGRHPCRDEFACIFFGFNMQQVVLSARNQRGRQACKPARFNWRCIRMQPLRCIGQVRAITLSAFTRTQIGINDFFFVGHACHAWIEQRRKQRLSGENKFTAIAGDSRKTCRQIAAGIVARNTNALCIRSLRTSICDHPLRGAITIFESRRKWKGGRQRITDRDHPRRRLACNSASSSVRHVQRPAHKTASVKIDDDRQERAF